MNMKISKNAEIVNYIFCISIYKIQLVGNVFQNQETVPCLLGENPKSSNKCITPYFEQ